MMSKETCEKAFFFKCDTFTFRQIGLSYPVLSSCARVSLCPRCSPGRDHPLAGGPSGGPVLEVGVCLQRQPFVSPWQSRLAGISLLYHIADSYMQHILFLFSMWRNRPDPVMWTKDGGELPDLDRMIVEGRELTFTSLNKTDNGTYRCEASNLLGTSSAEYVLFVYGEFRERPAPGRAAFL